MINLKVRIYDKPYSADPLEYDNIIHHIIFRSVFSPIITQYKRGDIVGIIAEKWYISKDHKTWSFKIRSDIHFENGDLITPEIVKKSWTRIAYLQKKRGSISGLFENLKEIERLTSLKSEIDGIKVDGDRVTLKFNKPMIKLIETISFGLYSIVHPSDYNSETGVWIDDKKMISSGTYRVNKWNDKEVVLILREDFLRGIGHPKPIKQVTIFWDNKTHHESDIHYGYSFQDIYYKDLIFYGPVLSGISYFRCFSWRHKDSPFYNVESRRVFRYYFYKNMDKFGYEPTYSFFPVVMSNVKELPLIECNKKDFKTNASAVKLKMPLIKSPYKVPFKKAILETLKMFGLKAKEVFPNPSDHFKENNSNLPNYSLDFSIYGTSILIENPEEDIRFMFLSKEGIQLPDTDGRITPLLKVKKLDIQKINELLWDQAVIWPLTHFAMGLWAKLGVDFSLINYALPPTDFRWLGWN